MADLFDKAIDSAMRSPAFPPPPPRPPVLRPAREGPAGIPGGLFLALLWAVLSVVVMPASVWPLVLLPAQVLLAVFVARACMALERERRGDERGRLMTNRGALAFGVLTMALNAGVWLGGRSAFFLLPILAGLLFVAGPLASDAWKRLSERPQADRDAAAILTDELPSPRRADFVRRLCRASVRHTLSEASKSLRQSLAGRPRVEAELRDELAAQYGEEVAEVVLDTALRNNAVRRYGAHLAMAMDGAYRAA